MKLFSIFLLLFSMSAAVAQHTPTADKPPYRETPARINNMVHTKMDVKFDYAKQQLHGKVWLTLQPHFYPTDSLQLDAKAMDIHKVMLVKTSGMQPLKYEYDGKFLNINLDKSYTRHHKYTVYVEYTAKPEEYDGKGSAAITDAKGLYFINPLGEDKNKPTQIWTQGETEATSVWVPVIDRPNQRTTQETIMTVPDKNVTLSNGKLVASKKNADGTRTDTWKMDQPHAPYLFFMGVGDYAVVKDQYKGKEVSYYVEKEYAPVARKIFGMTPEMMALYGRILGVEYPWVKYAQMTARDYVSGAMENTTATLHGEYAQQDARELTDGNNWEEVIAHELFHHWFGDYITTESWSNITMNESFATIGSQLWNEYKYGKDAADAERYNSLKGYYNSKSQDKPLVRFHYGSQEEVFDAVSYNKGAGILQMLRSHVGDSAFYRTLNLLLTRYKYQAVEPHHLRLVMEEVTGKDLNWFFNQWYYGAGHPVLDIHYSYEPAEKRSRMIVKQTQQGQVFTLPVKVAVWADNSRRLYPVTVQSATDTFYFPAAARPALVNFDADKILVAEKKENKTLDEYLFQYKTASNYLDRREAIDAALKSQAEVNAVEILKLALKDPFGPLRAHAANQLDMKKESIKAALEPALVEMARSEKYRLAKAAAISRLGQLQSPTYKTLFLSNVNDSSYTVSGNALEALAAIDAAAAKEAYQKIKDQPAKGKLKLVLQHMKLQSGDKAAIASLLAEFEDMPLSNQKFETLYSLKEAAKVLEDEKLFKEIVDATAKFMADVPEQYRGQTDPILTSWLKEIEKAKSEAGQNELAAYVAGKLKGKL